MINMSYLMTGEFVLDPNGAMFCTTRVSDLAVSAWGATDDDPENRERTFDAGDFCARFTLMTDGELDAVLSVSDEHARYFLAGAFSCMLDFFEDGQFDPQTMTTDELRIMIARVSRGDITGL